MRQPDQLDVQIHVELTEIRRQFAEASRRIATWTPQPAPTASNRTRYAPVRTNNQ